MRALGTPASYARWLAWAQEGRSRLERVSLRTLCLAIFSVALAVRLSGIFALELHHRWDVQAEWENIARNLASTGEFANPYPSPTGPTAHSAPAYPFLLSLVFRAVGTGPEGRLGCLILNAVLASLTYALLPLLSAVAGLPVLVGMAAAVLGAAVPPRLFSELMVGAGGTQLRALAWIAMQVLTLYWFRGDAASPARWLAYGACWGAAFHVDPALLPVCLFWAGVLGWRARRQAGFGVVSGLLLLLIGLGLALSPWTLRNRKQLGAWMFIRSNLGLELATDNTDSALPMDPWEYTPIRLYEYRQLMSQHPYGSARERERIRAIGEVAYNRERLREALEWIRRNPRRFAVLSLQRFRYFWFYPGVGKRYRNVVLYPMVILAGWGLLRMLRRHRFAGLLFLGDWIAYPSTYYFIAVSGRYRYPMEWTILLLSCYAVWEWWNARRPQS
jgi:hypothetical protein